MYNIIIINMLYVYWLRITF